MTVRKRPPYGKNILTTDEYIIICTGSEAWERAGLNSWLGTSPKVALPLNSNIDEYQWDFVINKEIVIFSNGEIIEPYQRLIELTRTLLAYGALKVLWCVPDYRDGLFISSEVSQ